MHKRLWALFLTVVMVVTTIPFAITPALAADPPKTGGSGLVYYQGSKVSDADRQAAAARVKAQMKSVAVSGSQPQSYMNPAATLVRDPVTRTLIPDYFGDANWAYSPILAKFQDSLPGLTPAGVNNLGQYIPVAVADTMTYSTANGTGPDADYYEIAVVEFTERMHSDLPPTRLRGYVQLSTPVVRGAHIALSNPDGTFIMMPDGVTRAYAVDNPHQLGPTIVATGALGGTGGTGKPVRIKFYNLLPAGEAGDLFIPVDSSVMGAGMGPYMVDASAAVIVSGNTTSVTVPAGHTFTVGAKVALEGFVPAVYNGEFRVTTVDATHIRVVLKSNPGGPATTPGTVTEMYQDNRATVHLHGNNTVWISDGTPHQWITPANENTSYPKGVSVVDVPDMPAQGDGSMTVFYTNAMSARLQFYHDHSMGITRLNVYAGEAAGYVITDQVEQDLINGTNVTGVNPGLLHVLPGIGTPLVIQDKTFVDPATIGSTDPTWLDANQPTFGTNPGTAVLGDLWYPHIYVPAQNPWAPDGLNAFGRWMWGPWFYPPTANLAFQPIPNPYCLPTPPPAGSYPNGAFNNSLAPWEAPYMPAIPNPSMPGEAFMDTLLVNGTVYPYMTVEPKAYRFRILDAADDRFMSLQWYVADPAGYAINAAGDPVAPGTGYGTEVKMVPAVPTAGFPSYANGDTADWPTDGRDGGVPDPATRGPEWWQLGTEGGFLPYPVVVPNQPIGWNQNPTTFNVGNVDRHSLLLGTAERADVIVDFAAFAGRTLILYNDAPAAFPARVPQYDYYTGDPDQRDSGGADTTAPGFGPNTRTVMQVRVGSTVTTPTTDVTLTNLTAVWSSEVFGESYLRYDGTAYLSNVTPNFRGADSSGAVEMWFNMNSSPNPKTLFASADEGTNIHTLYSYIEGTTGKIVISENAGANVVQGATNVADSVWHHVVISSSGTAWTILLDGVAQALTVVTGSNTGDWFADIPLRDNLMIGAVRVNAGTFQFANGDIGPTRIYSRAMAAPEALANYIAGKNGAASSSTGLVFNLNLSELTGNPVDKAGSLTMTNTNAVWHNVVAGSKPGVFGTSQDPIIIPGAAYNSAYSADFTSAPDEQYVLINRSTKTFTPINEAGALQTPLTLPIQPKAAHDEMGGVYDTEYGRMSGMLGLAIPATTSTIAQFIPLGYASPPVDIIAGSVAGTLIGSLDDGTQIWNLTHNGVDTHTIHTHLFNAQLINRVGWDGIMIPPDENELGWKETFRMNPLEQIFLAMRPITPNSTQVPFLNEVPNSIRLIDPIKPEGAVLDAPAPAGWFTPDGQAINEILNHYVNFGWEYVYHCHILAHEEMDMMHDVSMAVAPVRPSGLTATTNTSAVNLSWTDNSTNESNWIIQRSVTGTGNWTTIATVATTTGPAKTTAQYGDTSIAATGHYYYQVIASNSVGDVSMPAFPVVTRNSAPSNMVAIDATPAFTTVVLTGITASVPLVLDSAGVVTTTTVLTVTASGITINIPAGARLRTSTGLPLPSMTATTPASVAAMAATKANLLAVTFTPNGAVFDLNPVTITVPFDPNNLPQGVLPATLTIQYYTGAAWVNLPGTVVGANSVTATLGHFTDFALAGNWASTNLGVGWNFLSTPFKLATSSDTWGELSTLSGLNFSIAYRWNGTDYVVAAPTYVINPFDVILVRLNVAGTVPFAPFDGPSGPYSKNLVVGPNLIGTAFVDPTMPVNQALLDAYFGAGDVTGYTRVQSYSGYNQTPWTYLRNGATVPNMQFAKGYWVWMTNPVTLWGFTATP